MVNAFENDNGSGGVDDLDTLPQSWEAEQALLGALLYDNEIYHRVSGMLQAKHFYNPVNGRIYDQIAKLIELGQLADAIVLKDRFSQDETIEDIGGVEYLARLLANAPAAASMAAPEYARLIFDHAMRRELIKLGADISTAAKDVSGENSAVSLIGDAENKLFSLAEIGDAQGGFETFSQALIKSINMATAAFSRDGHLSGMSTGLRDIDRQLGGLHRSDLIILAGRPSMGKTSLATNIGFNVAKAFKEEKDENGIMRTVNGGRVGFFSLEMSSEQLATRLLAEQSGIPSHKIRRGDISAEQYERVRDAADEINSIPFFIDDTGGISIGQLSARARRLKRMAGLDLIIVDYLQLLTGGNQLKSSDGRVQEVSMITMGLKSLAKELDVPVLALAQLSRQVEQRDDKRPQLSDLRESGSIEQDADVVSFVFREEYYKARSEPSEGTDEHLKWQEDMEMLHGKAEVIVGKQRHGPIGTIKLAFTADITKFSDLAQDEHFGDIRH
jgi:replicative DNA helicase